MPRLTPAEKQDVIRFLEAEKPLPDKYRFLLFEDKREVELVWNGKTSEVCNLVLPFQVIEQVDEPRSESTKIDPYDYFYRLDERGRQLSGWTNKLIWGDNKIILSSLKNGPLREEIEWHGITRAWRYSKEKMAELDKKGLIVYSNSGQAYQKRYLDESKGFRFRIYGTTSR